MDTITLSSNQDAWHATFSDPEVAALFGTATILTPFSAAVPAATVLAAIQAKNPGSAVTLGAVS